MNNLLKNYQPASEDFQFDDPESDEDVVQGGGGGGISSFLDDCPAEPTEDEPVTPYVTTNTSRTSSKTALSTKDAALLTNKSCAVIVLNV